MSDDNSRAKLKKLTPPSPEKKLDVPVELGCILYTSWMRVETSSVIMSRPAICPEIWGETMHR